MHHNLLAIQQYLNLGDSPKKARCIEKTNLLAYSELSNLQRLFLEIPNQNPDLSWYMRTQLPDWMREASMDMILRRNTLHNSISILDRFLMLSQNFHRSKLQLLGVTCLFIASKIEEVEAPQMVEFSYMTTATFSCADIQKMELEVCKKVGWILTTGPFVAYPSDQSPRLLKESDQDKREPAYLMIKDIPSLVGEYSLSEK